MSIKVTESNQPPARSLNAADPEFDDTTAAGDWYMFRHRCAFVDASPIISISDTISLKRRFCLAYLGGRAQASGGVYMRSRPSVFTPAFVEKLANSNAKTRFSRYPWLERLINLLQQLDQDQYLGESQGSSLLVGQKPRQRLHVVPTDGLGSVPGTSA